MGEQSDERKYYDMDDNECSLDVLCSREPAWAANRLRFAEARLAQCEIVIAESDKLRGTLAAAEAKLAEAVRDARRMHYLGNMLGQRTQPEQDELTRLMRKYSPERTPGPVLEYQDVAENLYREREHWTGRAVAAEARIAELEKELAESKNAHKLEQLHATQHKQYDSDDER